MKTFVNPLTQIFHQRTATSQFGVQGAPTPDQTALLSIGSQPQSFSEDLNHHPSATRTILTTTIPKATQTGDFRPDNVRDVLSLFCLSQPSNLLPCCVQPELHEAGAVLDLRSFWCVQIGPNCGKTNGHIQTKLPATGNTAGSIRHLPSVTPLSKRQLC